MAIVEVNDDVLEIHVTGIDRILALKSTIAVPTSHVSGIDQDVAEASVVFHGLKLPGTGIPGVVTAGSFLKQGEWTFWDVHDPAKAVIIRLKDEHYSRLVIGVDDPARTVELVRKSLIH
ncbi:MAG TPA: hypothetical protein VG329_03415 [Candidatus Dormibacteraeota bacterium]|nr:hypothetical protein [Candidatus Dormibacteraeota bacterium]